jgi:DNA-binding CsgD family transcriptional regulator
MSQQLTYWLTMTNVPPWEWIAVVDQQRRVIGRSPDVDIPVPTKFASVSRRHAEIWVDRHGAHVQDIGSRSGTQVNRVWIKAHMPVLLQADDRIWMGGLELQIVDQLVPREKTDSVPDDDDEETIGRSPTTFRARDQMATLSPAEHAIVLCLCRGQFDDTDIGKILHRSPNTVRTQVSSILRKLGLHSRKEILAFLRGGQAYQTTHYKVPGFIRDSPYRRQGWHHCHKLLYCNILRDVAQRRPQ